MRKFLDLLDKTEEPNTKKSLVVELKKLGIKTGDTLLVHSSLSSLGYCVGGEHDVIQALMESVSETGNIIMPAHSSILTEPSAWENPPVPTAWHELIRKFAHPFDPKTTRTTGMGRIAETFRQYENVRRSYHPVVSFCAWGSHAHDITENHSLEYSLGLNSPLGRLYQMNTKILMLGTSYDTNTSIHLAEIISDHRSRIKQGSPVIENGRRVWKIYDDIDYDSDCFVEIGLAFEQYVFGNYEKNIAEEKIIKGKVGLADSTILIQKDLIDFAVKYFTNSDKA